MEIQKKHLTSNQFSRPGTYLNEVKGIVIHYTGNPGTSAQANRDYFENLRLQNEVRNVVSSQNLRYASAHYIVGLQGEIIECIPPTERAYHAGAKTYKPAAIQRLSTYPNNCTLGIELCHTDKTGNFPQKTLEQAARLAARLCITYHLSPRTDIYRHYDITGKICPRFFVENEREWLKFIETVENLMHENA